VTPTTNLDDGGTYRSSKGQRWLWRSWLDFWNNVEKVKKKNRSKVWTVFNGDMVDVNGKHMTSQQISQNEADVFRMAIDTLEPALEISDRFFVVRGTAAHTGSSGYLEEKIAFDIGAEKCGDQYSWWELLLECEGVQFDIRHHGPLGRLPHTRGNLLNRRAVELMLLYGSKVPQVGIQSHNHHFSTSSDEYPIKIYAQPAWQLKSEYVYRIGIVEPANIGGMYFVCRKGEYEPVVKRYKPEVQRAWKASRLRT
jgi:hypothetical protein